MKGYKVIKVVFNLGNSYTNDPKKEYEFLAFNCDDIHVDDVVIVDTVSGLQVATVVCEDTDSKKALSKLKIVVCKVDISNFEERKAHIKKLVELKRDIDKRVKELYDESICEMLASTDNQLADMLTLYKSIQNIYHTIDDKD